MIAADPASPPRRVLLVTAADERGGAEEVIERIGAHLDRARFTPVFAAPASGRLLERWRGFGWQTRALPAPGRLRRLDQSALLVALLSTTIARDDIDIVHTHGVAAQIHAGWAARRTGRRAIYHVHDLFDGRWSADGMLQRVALRVPSDRRIAISKTVADALPSWLRLGTITVFNGVESAIVEPVVHEQPLVVWCGRLQWWKGAHLFIEAARMMHASRPDVRFAIVGSTMFGLEPAYADQLRRQTAEYGLADVVTFAGHVDDARPWLRAAALLIHCSERPEPFGLVIPEAMMQECPVVAFRQGGAAEIVVDAETGCLAPPRDVRTLADAALRVLADDEMRRTMGRAARQRAIDHFEAGAMTRAIEGVYDDVGGRPAQASKRPGVQPSRDFHA